MKQNEKAFFVGVAVIADLLFHEGRMTMSILEILTDKMKDEKKNIPLTKNTKAVKHWVNLLSHKDEKVVDYHEFPPCTVIKNGRTYEYDVNGREHEL